MMINKVSMLWVDLRISSDVEQLPIGMQEFFDIRHCSQPEDLGLSLKGYVPDVVCFDFDYPDRAGLQLAQATKERYSAIPMILITLQHSERLAVWAFRSRFSDYLVKPIPLGELTSCHGMLADIREAKRHQGHRKTAALAPPIPTEAGSGTRNTDNLFLPAIYYVAQNYSEKIQNTEVANLCAMSPFVFSRKFKDSFGITFRDYVVRYRLRAACGLLKNPDASITDVAFAVGFNDVGYFSRMFKRHFGVPPSEKQADRAFSAADESPTALLKIPAGLIRDSFR
jgi:AraC-like DNA-binding protein